MNKTLSSNEQKRLKAKKLLAELNSPKVKARNKILNFTKYTFPEYRVDRFHYAVSEALDMVVQKKIDRLMIFAPPQHGKSELVSVRLPAFYLGNYPDESVAILSYGASLARKKSRYIRNLIQSNLYRRLFPTVGIAYDSRAKDNWSIAAPYKGELWAGGMNSAITGIGFKLIIIDDPHKDWIEANSKLKREKVWDTYQNTVLPRLQEGGAIILVMTKWHNADLAGRILESESGWKVLRFPAISEPESVREFRNQRLGLPEGLPDLVGRKEEGLPLAPKLFSIAALEKKKSTLSKRGWNAQYQGFPISATGGMFSKDNLNQFISKPIDNALFRVRYWDKASTEDDGDYTAGVLISTDGIFFYVEDVIRGQWSTAQREQIIKYTAHRDLRTCTGKTQYFVYHEQEGGSGGKDSAVLTQETLKEFSSFVDKKITNKELAAEPLSAAVENKRVYLVEAPWNEEFIEELVDFLTGKNDDMVDAASGAYRKIKARTDRWMEQRKKLQKNQGSYSQIAI